MDIFFKDTRKLTGYRCVFMHYQRFVNGKPCPDEANKIHETLALAMDTAIINKPSGIYDLFIIDIFVHEFSNEIPRNHTISSILWIIIYYPIIALIFFNLYIIIYIL